MQVCRLKTSVGQRSTSLIKGEAQGHCTQLLLSSKR